LIPVDILNRPFSTELATGFMLPDGFFESSWGRQGLNAYFTNTGAATINEATIFVESTSHPNIRVRANTHHISSLAGQACTLLSWEVDLTGAPPGIHRISFIVQTALNRTRIIKKIFVTRSEYNASTNTFSLQVPEGRLDLLLKKLLGPRDPCCRELISFIDTSFETNRNIIKLIDVFMQNIINNPEYKGCTPYYLIQDFELTLTHTPPFGGQYPDLPFQDPWWKDLFVFLALLAIAVLKLLGGDIRTRPSGSPPGGPLMDGGQINMPTISLNCCSTPVRSEDNGGRSLVAWTIITLLFGPVPLLIAEGDSRDLFRRGEDNTLPVNGEITTKEHIKASISYPEPIASGKPFAVSINWEYTRTTTGRSYNYSVARETKTNNHVLSRYQINAPNVVRAYAREPFIVKAQFFGSEDKMFSGRQLYVQCMLEGTGPLKGQYRHFVMQDNGIDPDQRSGDGVYTGVYYFKGEDHGLWMFYVIAQDVNSATDGMPPEEAAKIIGGVLLTHQLTVSCGEETREMMANTNQESTCQFVTDGHVNVI
jgi:hypothetical protein